MVNTNQIQRQQPIIKIALKVDVLNELKRMSCMAPNDIVSGKIQVLLNRHCFAYGCVNKSDLLIILEILNSI